MKPLPHLLPQRGGGLDFVVIWGFSYPESISDVSAIPQRGGGLDFVVILGFSYPELMGDDVSAKRGGGLDFVVILGFRTRNQ